MQLKVQIVNAFIDGASGGNPAGVVLQADGLTTEQKLAVAQQVGLSETAFVSASDVATIKLEFFTPTRQIAHCGHATIATFSLLRQLNHVPAGQLSKETIDGLREIIVADDQAFMQQLAPRYQQFELSDPIAQQALESLNLGSDALLSGSLPTLVNTGNSFLIIGLASEQTLAELQPNFAQIQQISEQLDLIGYYVFTPATKQQGRSAGTRMFAPRYGIREEAGTGMAAGPLACYLYDKLGLQQTSFLIEQGWLMQPASPSVIEVQLKLADGAIQSLLAGGRAKVMQTLEVEL
ncbi:PhzF family phenazine biosynthesis protein [Herpetosiphon llansteffanensis]|uniref:PhzF family phenazine biosynthesis protein n=1 Tax=Herpetosiphon llansteffanensis TaxID=2094568 RepID=UPI000D7C5180|nr:PhzF family phenazine biosynthesis protein [Herpetosiphon llansteffanensis]